MVRLLTFARGNWLTIIPTSASTLMAWIWIVIFLRRGRMRPRRRNKTRRRRMSRRRARKSEISAPFLLKHL